MWLSFAQFELSVNDENSLQRTRSVYRQANGALKDCDEKEERLMLLEAWKEFEVSMHHYVNVWQVRINDRIVFDFLVIAEDLSTVF